MTDFYIFSFLFKLFTISVYIYHKQFYFLFYTVFLPPNINNREPINVEQWLDIPYSKFCSFIKLTSLNIWENGFDIGLICFHYNLIKSNIQISLKIYPTIFYPPIRRKRAFLFITLNVWFFLGYGFGPFPIN